MNTLFDTIVVVLVEPQSPGNIGMVCRAMKNMGLTRLRLVAGCDHQHPDAIMFAVSARDLLDRAECYPTLAAALADTTISVGTTRRTGKYRQELLTPPQVATTLQQR
ncbi:MAG: RNA methyltransferase, partial [Geobacter sp.]